MKRIGRLFMIVVLLLIFFQTNLSASVVQCARSTQQLTNLPSLAKRFESVGGPQALEGIWTFPGIFGLGQTTIVFQNRENAFYARLGKSAFKPILICESTSSDALEIQILDSANLEAPQIVWFKIKNNSQIELAAEKSNWTYHTFRRDRDTLPTYQVVDANQAPLRPAGTH